MIWYYTYNRAIFLYFKHLYTCYAHFLYFFLDRCVRMEMYLEAARFVSILLDFSKNKMYTRGFNKGHARTWFLALMNSALPEILQLMRAIMMGYSNLQWIISHYHHEWFRVLKDIKVKVWWNMKIKWRHNIQVEAMFTFSTR